MKLKHLASLVCLREGKKRQISIGNAREVIAIISDLVYEKPHVMLALLTNGERRSLKRKGRIMPKGKGYSKPQPKKSGKKGGKKKK